MKFSKLAQYLESLEETTSRNKITEILAKLFKESSPGEIDKITYLLLGRIAPQYTGIEFNLAERLMVRVVAQAYSVEPGKVQKQYKQKGDLGNVAFDIAKEKGKSQESALSISEVYESLSKVAEEQGGGSQGRKLAGISELLRKLDPRSSKYVVRIPVGKLRLGFSDITMLDALSVMEVGDKSARKEIESHYNVMADIGKIAQEVKKKGSKLGLAVAIPGVPIRASLSDRLPSAEKIIEKVGPKVAVEPKLDGFRCISGFTPIHVEGKGFISVKNIEVGDKVLTHKGKFKKVTAVKKRTIDKGEKLFRFQTYLANDFKISEQHKVLCWKGGKARWIYVENISVGDEVVFPKPSLISTSESPPNPHVLLEDTSGYTKTVSASKDFYRFLGFCIGDGFTNDYHNTERIGLLFNAKKERELSKTYRRIINETFGVSQVSDYEYGGALSIYFRDKPLREWLTQYFRRDWRGKVLPSWFGKVSKENFLAFLQGWIESDGTPRHGGGFKVVTKERDLASFVQLLGLYHGKVLGLRKVRNKISSIGYVRTYYQLIVPGTERKAKIVGDKVLIKVMKKEEIKRPDPRTQLYNLQVEGDESYCTGMVALHNCQIHVFKGKKGKEARVFSRNHENVTNMFPDIVEAARKLSVRDAIFDAEAIGYNPKTHKFTSFQETVQRKRKYGISEMAKKVPLKAFIFDVLYLNGKTLMNESFSKRREVIEKVLRGDGGIISLIEQEVIDSAAELRELFEKYFSEGAEGLMAKKLDAAYQAGGRGFHWVKFKKLTEVGSSKTLPDTIDCVLMGAFRGRGKRAQFGVGGFLLGIPGGKDKFYTISNLGTGLTDEQFRNMYRRVKKLTVKEQPKDYVVDKIIEPDIWTRPGLVLEILADEITLSPRHTAGRDGDGRGYSLRFPRLIRVRDDKSPQQATSVKEVQKLYKIQKK